MRSASGDVHALGLLRAAAWGNASGVRTAIAANADVNQINRSGETALILAAKNSRSQLEAVCSLINAGCHVNTSARSGTTALLEAVSRKHTSVVSALIDARADHSSMFALTLRRCSPSFALSN